MASPSPSRLLPMIAPVSCALTTSGLPAARTKRARISSAVLPNDTFNSPPIAGPALSARCSVARRIHSARGITANVAMTNVEIESGDVRYALAADAGTSNRSHVKMSFMCATPGRPSASARFGPSRHHASARDRPAMAGGGEPLRQLVTLFWCFSLDNKRNDVETMVAGSSCGNGASGGSAERGAPGADVVATAPKPSPLADAVQRGDAATIQALLKKKVDVNAQQANGATALHWAAYRRDAESTAALIRAGANVNLKNNYGVTPLALAAQQGNPAVLDLLLKAGAKPNDPVNFVNAGETPLMSAARSASVDAVKALARAGADVNAKETWSGQTALMWAAAEGDSAMASTLLELGADLRARSNGGTTAFQFAVRKGDMPTVQAMLAARGRRQRQASWRFCDTAARRHHQRSRRSGGPAPRQGRRSERRGGHDHADQHGLEGERGQDHAEDPFVPRTVAGCRHRRGQRAEQQLGKTALRRRARRQLVCE